MSNHRYSPDFKDEAVRLIYPAGHYYSRDGEGRDRRFSQVNIPVLIDVSDALRRPLP